MVRIAALLLSLMLMAAFPATAQEDTTHTVVRGDTLFRIAQRYDVTIEALVAANNIANPSRILAGTVLIIPGSAPAPAAADAAPAAPTAALPTVTHIVQRGEALSQIARSYGVSLSAIAGANNIRNINTIFTGQQLVIPNANPGVMAAVAAAAPAAAPITAPIPASASTHRVQPGETLSIIARRYGLSWTTLAAANGITNPDRVFAGTSLRIPGSAANAQAAAVAPGPRIGTGREIVVILSTQMIYAYEDGVLVRSALSSTGRAATPTIQGDFRVYARYASASMSGPGYYLPGVPWILYFYQGYAIHGTYWHNNFGTPMSRGCVNLPPDEARWFFDFAPIGTHVHVRWS